MINSERLLREAREQDHTCEFCYYEFFDDRAYPCSRCVCNQPTENLWRPKPQVFGKHADVMIVDDCETCRHKYDGTVDYCKTCGESNYEPKDEPQTCETCKYDGKVWYCTPCLGCDNHTDYEPKDEPQKRSE